jgi:hypothetical protein
MCAAQAGPDAARRHFETARRWLPSRPGLHEAATGIAPKCASAVAPFICWLWESRGRATVRLAEDKPQVGQQNVAFRSIAQNVDDAAARARQVSSIISAANDLGPAIWPAALFRPRATWSQQAVVLQSDAAGFIGQVKAG